jgi:NAD(P)-dependent dehydrogenase (short-subunit alcohol dehydrogenase family)
MKIVIVGASGTIGKKVTEAVRGENEIITAGSKSGDVQVDITSTESIEAFYKQVGNFDALISVTGNGYMGPFKSMTAKDFNVGLQSKLLGQINLVLVGQHYVNPKGSFTLTSGILAQDPVISASNLSTINAGINSFAKAASIELENGVRINAVSAGVVEDSPDYFPYFPGHIPVAMDKVTNAYYKSVFGPLTGQVFEVW